MLKNKATVHFHIHYQDEKQAYGEKVCVYVCLCTCVVLCFGLSKQQTVK